MFTGWVERISSSCLEQNFSCWNDPSLALVPPAQIEAVLKTFDTMFSICASVLCIASNANGDNNQAMRKMYLSLYHCILM